MSEIEPENFKWRHMSSVPEEKLDICFFTEACLPYVEEVQAKRKIAWLIEPEEFRPNHYEYVEKNQHLFNYILTFSKKHLERNSYNWDKVKEKWLFIPASGSYIEKEDWGIREKSKLCSFVVSYKNELDGHKMRHKIVQYFGLENKLFDLFGSGYGKYATREEAFAPYMFTICVQAVNESYFFNELVFDAFALGTIPIYCGTNSINTFFNTQSILKFRSIKRLQAILEGLSTNIYKKQIKAVKENLEFAKKFQSVENFMWEQYPELFSE